MVEAVIERYTEEAFVARERAIQKALEEPARYLFEKIKGDVTFYGATAIELELGRTPKFPFYGLSDKKTEHFVQLFKEIKKRFRTIFKIDPIGQGRLFKLDLQPVLFLYPQSALPFERIGASEALCDLYNAFSLPERRDTWPRFAELDEELPGGSVGVPTREKGEMYRKNWEVLVKGGVLDLPALVSGAQAYGDILGEGVEGPVVLVAYDARPVLEFLLAIYGEEARIEVGHLMYFKKRLDLSFRGENLITILLMQAPLIYYGGARMKRTNYHTTYVILMLLGERKMAGELRARAKGEDLLGDGPFACFQTEYLPGSVEYFMRH